MLKHVERECGVLPGKPHAVAGVSEAIIANGEVVAHTRDVVDFDVAHPPSPIFLIRYPSSQL